MNVFERPLRRLPWLVLLGLGQVKQAYQTMWDRVVLAYKSSVDLEALLTIYTENLHLKYADLRHW